MNLKHQLEESLQRLEGQPGSAVGGETIALQVGPCSLRCELEAVDKLACAIVRLSVASPKLALSSLEELHVISQALAAKLTYLLEAIAVIEVDAAGSAVQLRSQPPHLEGARASYYELVAGRGELELRRYAKESGAPRRQVSALLTREVLVRLAEDLTHAAS